jgi:hypothetical protein
MALVAQTTISVFLHLPAGIHVALDMVRQLAGTKVD